ncbi:MAG TPA: HlyD family type I secretion periplasmic adaptor subunit [Aestuariivirgaceae bacterium]|nr:HlyD family type I secretion periplasmic adaptor subunit [Aestuariivirgaceae bacterium]
MSASRPSAAPPRPSAALRTALRPVALASVGVAALFVGGFSAWGFYAPLASAAIAPGVVSPDSSLNTIQHLEGGIVQEILVTEGDRVEKGDLLMRLSPVQAQASFSARERQWRRFEAERLRLEALEVDAESFAFPPELTSLTDPDFQTFLANQQAQFGVQRQGLSERQAILGRRLGQLDQEVAAIERENEGLREQLDIVSEEIADKAQLLEQNLIRKPELLALRRLASQLKSQIASNEATIARAGQKAEEIELQILSLKTEFQDQLAHDLVRVNSELAQLEESMTSSRDVFRRTEIFAPVSGRVHNLRFETIGGIVRPGEKILDIVPAEDALVIEARLSPNDIDVVAVGQMARVHLTPYSARSMAPLEGHLVRISPDAKVDEATRETYYEVRIEVDPDMLERMATKVEMTPGMPAEVFILTGEQSLFSYMTAPVTSSFRRAFRED